MFGNFAIIIILYLSYAVDSYIIPNSNSSACGPYSEYKAHNSCVCHEGFKVDSSGLCQPDCKYCDHGICIGPDNCDCLPGYEKTSQVIENDEIIDICEARVSTRGSTSNAVPCPADCDCWNELDKLGNVINSRACLTPCRGHFAEHCLNITDCKCCAITFTSCLQLISPVIDTLTTYTWEWQFSSYACW